jgi:hypothetical protein
MPKLKIVLSETAPRTIDTKTWPVIASAERHDGAVECQANTLWGIIVREHSDGRRLVYGYQKAGPGGRSAGFRELRGGYLLDQDGYGIPEEQEVETIRAIRRCAGIIDDAQLGANCIADLPAREL